MHSGDILWFHTLIDWMMKGSNRKIFNNEINFPSPHKQEKSLNAHLCCDFNRDLQTCLIDMLHLGRRVGFGFLN